jgi:hypothetical protein
MIHPVEPSVFEEVAAIFPGLVPDELGPARLHVRRWGIKVWFGSEPKAPRDHYEAQVIGSADAPGAKVTALEVGFHAEHSKEAENEALLAGLVSREAEWRAAIGGEPTCGPFLGRASHWRRISEIWADPDFDDPGLPFEIAARLTDFVAALEPIRGSPEQD